MATKEELVNGKIVRTIVYLIEKLGVTTVIILILLGMITGYIPSPVTETRVIIQAHADQTLSYQSTQLQILREIVKAQRISCVTQARTEADKRLCVE